MKLRVYIQPEFFSNLLHSTKYFFFALLGTCHPSHGRIVDAGVGPSFQVHTHSSCGWGDTQNESETSVGII